MGFFENATSEFGKKTGKALGNKLYGEHADDMRIGVRNTTGESKGSSSGGVDIESQIEMANHKKQANLEKELLKLEFDNADIQANFKTLFNVMPMVDAWIKDGEDSAKLYQIARAKFDAGVLMCQMIDISNPTIQLLLNKQKEWDDILKKSKKKKIIKTIFIIFGILALISGLIVLAILEG